MVRLADMEDIPTIVSMIKSQSLDQDISSAKSGFSMSKVANLVRLSITQSLAWVSDNDGINGLLVAREQLNTFSNIIKETHIVSLYVLPEFRKGSVWRLD